MWQFLFFILFIIIMHVLSKTMEEAQKKTQTESKEYEIFGFPPLEFPLPQQKTKEEIPKKIPIIIEKKEIETKKEPEALPKVLPTKPKSEFILDFDKEKLEEAIILSEILGPPKALKR